jgi:hypothetical protein
LKGELEDDIEKAGVRSLHIYQPSMLIGERKANRWLEKLPPAYLKLLIRYANWRLKKIQKH